MPFFSVIVPVYNAERFVSQCIESVLVQSFSDFELIIINDGSKDNSGDICDRYSKIDKRVKVIHKENKGVVCARKIGIINSTGEYIVSLDSDDYLSGNMLEDVYIAIKNNQCDIISFGAIAFSDKDEFKIGHEMKPGVYIDKLEEVKSKFIYDKSKGKLNWGIMLYSLWSKVIKRSILIEAQLNVPDNICKGDDLAVLAPILYKCSSLEVLSGDYYWYRINNESIMHNYSFENILKNKELVRYLRQYCIPKYEKNLKMCELNMMLEHFIGLIRQSSRISQYYSAVNFIYQSDSMLFLSDIEYREINFIDKFKIFCLKKNPILLYFVYKTIFILKKI